MNFPAFKHKDLKQPTLMLQCLKDPKNLWIKLIPPDGGLECITESLKDIIHPNTLDIQLADKDLCHKSLEIFSNHIAHHQLMSISLTRERLDFFEFPDFPIISAIKSGVRKLVSIWKPSTLAPFFSNMRSSTQLSQLVLRLSPYYISTQEWKQLSLALNQLKELSSLSLTLPKFDSMNNFEGLQCFLSCL